VAEALQGIPAGGERLMISETAPSLPDRSGRKRRKTMSALRVRTSFELSWATWIVIVAVLLVVVSVAMLYLQ
jgi:hypothetical protein